jgi:glucose-1-phosphate cytidylyltransferase
MKVIILAGGLGTRIMEETHNKPKPMVEIGGKPILHHIMDIYARYTKCDFKIAAGYKKDVIQKYIETIDYNVEVIDTGSDTGTAGRIRKIMKRYPSETFMVTYGDGLANIDISELLAFHKSHGKIATVTAVRPVARFGRLVIENNSVVNFAEKLQADEGWINGGFFVFESGILEYIEDDSEMLEHRPLNSMSQAKQLMAYLHTKFWQPMDTLREKNELELMLKSNTAPWQNM